MKKINFGNREIYQFGDPYIIAEIGANHNGEMDLAKKMIYSAKKCGADCVKFQSWTPKSLVSKSEYEANQVYTDSKKKHFGSLKEMIEKYYLNEQEHQELSDYCKEINIDFASTPFSKEEGELLVNLNVPFIKIASMDVNNTPLLEEIAKLKKPTIISTGMASLKEITEAVEVFYDNGNKDLALLHCISIYPPNFEDINLNNIKMLHDTFGVPVGFSDHSIGFSIPLASVALGACIIEKHFTLDKDLPGWDHEISADPSELSIICKESKNINRSLGSYRRKLSEAEILKRDRFRRSLVFRTELKKGEVVRMEHLISKRPGKFHPPNEMKNFIGRTLKKDVEQDTILQMNLFE